MRKYDPENHRHRRDLAGEIQAKLTACGFTRDRTVRSKEQVWTRSDRRGFTVKVYTSIYGRSVRKNGTDAIRVCATKGGRGLVKTTRVNRTGEIDGIVDRMHNRMRTVWKTAVSRS